MKKQYMENKKILIIGASILQLPAIKRAKGMGLTVGVVDYNSKAVGIPFANEYYNVSTIDREGILAVAKEFQPDGIMTMATDMPMRTIAYVCKKIGLNSISEECAFNCTDKIEMIKRFKAHNVPSPMYAEADRESDLSAVLEGFGFPLIMKPADNSGSRGVVKVESLQECKDNLEYVLRSSRNGKIIIEEFMQGPEVSVEVFAVKGKAHVLQITDKLTTGAPHFVEMGHSQPSTLEKSVKAAIESVAQQAVTAVGLVDGPAHLEMIITSSGPKMVEMGARMGGDCITSHLVPLSTGIDMTEQTINCALGLPVDLEPKISKSSAIRFLTAEQGKISSIDGAEQAKAVEGVKFVEFFKTVGDTATEIFSSGDRIGYVIAQGDSVEEAISACQKASRIIKIGVEKQENV